MTLLDFTSDAYKRAPDTALQTALESGPIVRARLPGQGKVWLVTHHDAITDLLKSPHRFASDAQKVGRRQATGLFWSPRTLRVLPENMLVKDAPTHTRLRAITEKALARQRVESLRPTLAHMADDLLDTMDAAAEADLVEGFARPFALAVICELLGLSEDMRPKFMKWSGRLTSTPRFTDRLLRQSARRQIIRLLKSEFEDCKSSPREGLLSAFAHPPAGEDQLSEDERIAACFLCLSIGHETTTHLISAGAFVLLQHPDQLERLKKDWSLSPACIDEIIRFCAPAQMTQTRYVISDLEFHGAHLKRGDRILGFLAAAGRDPAIHDAPDTFDIFRKTAQTAAFGLGAHACPSAQLARAQTEIALERIFSRWPDMRASNAPEWTARPDLRGLRHLKVNTHA